MDWSGILTQTISASIGPYAVVFILAAQGLNIHYGFTGLLNFGQAGFMAVGAYGLAITCASEASGGYDQPLWLGVIVGLLAAVLLALVMGLPTLRLRGDYLAIVTIAVSEIIRLMVRSEAFEGFTGGNSGINGFGRSFYEVNPFARDTKYVFGPFEFQPKDLWIMAVGWTVVGFFALLTFFLVRSPWGRLLKSIRENEDAVRALGKNVQGYKLQSLVLGGLMGACGGMLLAMWQILALPDDYATRTTFIAYTALIVGGTATTFGPVFGGMIWYTIFAFTQNFVAELAKTDSFPSSLKDTADVLPLVVLGITLMVLVVVRPQGALGNRREVELDAR